MIWELQLKAQKQFCLYGFKIVLTREKTVKQGLSKDFLGEFEVSVRFTQVHSEETIAV